MKEQKITMGSEEDTKAYGLTLSKELKAGDVIALIGDLGTGKTALVKWIALGLGVDETVTSPTFTIVNEHYSGRLPLYHFDVYRINDEEEIYDLGYEEYFFGTGVCVVEWADQIFDLIPAGSRVIRIEYGESENSRIYHIGVKV